MLKVRNFVPKSVLMLSAAYSEFRKDLKQFLDQVITNVDTLIIHRGSGKAVVVMSLEEYNALCATSHELSSIKNKARLDASIQQIGANMIDFIPE
jgi:antitoxin YefM